MTTPVRVHRGMLQLIVDNLRSGPAARLVVSSLVVTLWAVPGCATREQPAPAASDEPLAVQDPTAAPAPPAQDPESPPAHAAAEGSFVSSRGLREDRDEHAISQAILAAAGVRAGRSQVWGAWSLVGDAQERVVFVPYTAPSDGSANGERDLWLARVSVPAGAEPALDRRVRVITAQAARLRNRRVEDMDGDGRLELGLALAVTRVTGGPNTIETPTREQVYLDADTLDVQLRFDLWRDDATEGGEGRLRSLVSRRDRNGDGRPDFSVRQVSYLMPCAAVDAHGIPSALRVISPGDYARLLDGEPVELPEPAEGTPESACAGHEERWVAHYDVERDVWRRSPDAASDE